MAFSIPLPEGIGDSVSSCRGRPVAQGNDMRDCMCRPGNFRNDADQDEFVSTFTAMSADGRAVWGVRATGQN